MTPTLVTWLPLRMTSQLLVHKLSQMVVFKEILHHFSLWSGICISIPKSILLLPPDVDAYALSIWQAIWPGIRIAFSGKTLGVPTGVQASVNQAYSLVLDKFHSSLSTWRIGMYGKHEATLLWNSFLLPLYSYLMQFWSPPIHFLRELRRCRLRILRLSPSFTANQLTYLDYLTRLPPAKDPALLAQATLLRFQRTCPVDLDTLAFARRSSRPTFSIDWQWTQARLNWPTHALPWALVQRQLDIFSGRMTIVTPISSSSVPEDTTWRIYYDGSFNPSTGQMGWAVVLTIASLTRLEGYGSVQVDHRGLNYHGAVHRSCFTAEANAPLEFAIFANTASFGAPWLTARSCLWHHTDNKSVLSLLLGRPPKSEFPLSSKLQAWLLILQSHWSLSSHACSFACRNHVQ